MFNYLAGSLSRIFTTLQEVPDNLILYGFIAGFLLNAVLATQMVYYWNSPASKASTQTKLHPKRQQGALGAMGVNGQANASGSEKNKTSPSTTRRG